jgi:Tfp pilus assembly protein PilF
MPDLERLLSWSYAQAAPNTHVLEDPMRRFLALLILLLLPSAVMAQKEPPHTKETKSAEKFIGLALTRQDPAQKRQFLQQAVPPLQEAMQKDPNNARVWLMAGSVYSGLDQFAAADSAFDRALQLHAPYAEQIENDRHAAWESAFNTAVQLINAQKTQEGITALENAELLYPHRPEAKYYLGLFYTQKDQLANAERALRASIAAVNGPVRAKLPAAATDEWDRLAVLGKIKLSNVLAFQGAALYDKQQYDSAAALFASARQLNTVSRDHLFNQLQSAYARALDLDKERTAAKSPALDQRARTLYSTIISLTDSLRAFDPLNEDIYFFSSRAQKVLSDLTADAPGKTRHTNALRAINTEYEGLAFVISDVQIAEGDSTATVKGNVRNKTLKAGATGNLTFELMDYDGKVMGSAPITFSVPASAAAGVKEPTPIPFTAIIPMKSALAGWRYK